MLCHFRICAEISRMRDRGVWQKTLAFYLFRNLDQSNVKVARPEGLSNEAIWEGISNLRVTSYTAESDEDSSRLACSSRAFITKPSIRFLIEDFSLVSWYCGSRGVSSLHFWKSPLPSMWCILQYFLPTTGPLDFSLLWSATCWMVIH